MKKTNEILKAINKRIRDLKRVNKILEPKFGIHFGPVWDKYVIIDELEALKQFIMKGKK